jgi:sporadic carbohydrate cluster protein (TIGR04323 family)
MKLKKVRGYIFCRPFMGERAPQHVQNIVIRDYCKKNKLSYLLSLTEYAMENCHIMLEQALKELKSIDGIVVYSLFQLPEDKKYRSKVYKKILKFKKEIHFSVEGLKITKKQDIKKIEDIWMIKQTLPECLKTTIK